MQLKGIFKLGTIDFIKGLVVAVLAAVLTVIQSSIDAGDLNFNWPLIAKVSLSAAVAYLVKNLLTNNQGEMLKKDV